MANNYRLFSEMLPLRTDEERGWCNAELQTRSEEDNHGDTQADFAWRLESEGLWIYAEEYGNVDHVAEFVQEFLGLFNPTGAFHLSWADTCSRPRLGEFGGGAIYVTKDKIKTLVLSDWLSDRDAEYHQELKRLFQR